MDASETSTTDGPKLESLLGPSLDERAQFGLLALGRLLIPPTIILNPASGQAALSAPIIRLKAFCAAEAATTTALLSVFNTRSLPLMYAAVFCNVALSILQWAQRKALGSSATNSSRDSQQIRRLLVLHVFGSP